MTSKKKGIVKISIAAVVIVLAALLALFGLKVPPISRVYGLKSLDRALDTGLAFGGGYAASYTAADASAEQLATAADVLGARLGIVGFEDARALADESGVRIEFPSVSNPTSLAEAIGQTGHAEFRDPSGSAIATGANVASVAVEQLESGYFALNLEFDAAGREALAAAAEAYAGQTLSLYVDDQSVSSVTISDDLADGSFALSLGSSANGDTAESSLDQATGLYVFLQSGELPVALELGETAQVGPSLGAGVVRGLGIAAAVVMLLAIAEMVVRFRLPGAAAGMSLSLYLLIALYAAAIGGARMAVAGALGMLVSFVLAIESNELLLRRFCVEMTAGRTPHNAVRFAGKTASRKVLMLDGIPFVVALIVALAARGVVRSFAVTLAIGSLTALIAAMWFTRSLVDAFCELGGERRSAYMR